MWEALNLIVKKQILLRASALRHSFATHHLCRFIPGGNKTMLGHQNFNTTLIYEIPTEELH
jgi:site-specific recombinase XerD